MSNEMSWREKLSYALLPRDKLDAIREIQEEHDNMAYQLQRANQKINALTKERGLYHSKWKGLSIGDYNPEEIELDEYQKMLNYDAQVIAGFDLIQMGVLMKPWRIEHPDNEIVDTLTRALNRMKWPTFRGAMKEMLKALVYGYSVTEIVFDTYKKYWMPRQKNGLKTLDPRTITFFSDPGGNLKRIRQRLGGNEVDLPLDRTLIWTHEKEWGNWYGKSILRGCYKNWYIKDAMLKFANIAYERFGSPILLGIAASDSDRQKVAEAIQHLYAYSQAVIRKTDENDPTAIDVIESKRTEMPFDRYIRYHNEMILRRMLIGQNVFEGGGSSYGPKVPLDLVFMRFKDFRLELTTMINNMLQVITDLNWKVDTYPKISFSPLTAGDQRQIAAKIWDAIDRKVVHPTEGWIREELQFPVADEEIRKRLEREYAEEHQSNIQKDTEKKPPEQKTAREEEL